MAAGSSRRESLEGKCGAGSVDARNARGDEGEAPGQ